MARILLIADAGVPTGFGTVSKEIFERLVRDYHHEVHVIAINWRGDTVDTPMRFYLPTQKIPGDILGQSRYVELLAKVMPDIIFFINDPAVVLNVLTNSIHDVEGALWRGMQIGDTVYKPPILAYLPIDGYENPTSWDFLTQRVQRIAMSQFGQQAMPEATVVWHGIDHNVFKPQDRKDAKRSLGFDPDRFLVLRVDKNSFRKDYPDTWRALRPVMRRHTDIDVHFHCLPIAPDGYDLRAAIWNDEDIRERVSFSPNLTGFEGWGINHLAALYSAADLFVSTSWGEGFGLTLAESMACGTPVIATDCSSITEVVGDGGILIPPAGTIPVPAGQRQMLPDVPAFTNAIQTFYQSAGMRRELRAKAIAQAAKFSWDDAARLMNTEIVRALGPTVVHAEEEPVPA